MAPEVSDGGHYHAPADVFSFGMLLCEVFTCKKASAMSYEQMRTAKEVPKNIRELALKCLQSEQLTRPTFEEIVVQLEDEYGMLTKDKSVSSRKEIAALKADKLNRDVVLQVLTSQFEDEKTKTEKKRTRVIAKGIGGR